MRILTIVCHILLFLLSTNAFATEALSCKISIALPDAESLRIFPSTEGVKVISESFTPAEGSLVTSSKIFEITLEEGGKRSLNIDPNEFDHTKSPLQIDFFVGKKAKFIEVIISASSRGLIDGANLEQLHPSNMLCAIENKKCYGNFSNSLNNGLGSKTFRYMNYGVHCKPL